MTTLCNHGFFQHDCALCVKRPGECDFGSCTRPATTRASSRPMCDHHAAGAHAEWQRRVRDMTLDSAA